MKEPNERWQLLKVHAAIIIISARTSFTQMTLACLVTNLEFFAAPGV